MIWTTPDLCDELRDEARPVPGAWHSYGGRPRFCGPVLTISVRDDNSRVKELAGTPGDGRVMLVDNRGSLRRAMLGDRIAATAADHGWAGVVIVGAVRDVRELAHLPLGVFALGTCPMPTVRLGVGMVGLPVTVDGTRVRTGEWLFADEDGVLVTPTLPAAALPATPLTTTVAR